MEQTPKSVRKHVALVGNTNAGKSTLFNALTGHETAIVSPLPGTTTDPVQTAMELVPFGPIVLIDTAGLDDDTALGSARTNKTSQVLNRCDAALYIADFNFFSVDEYHTFVAKKIPHLLIFTKCNASDLEKQRDNKQAANALFYNTDDSVSHIQAALSKLLSAQTPDTDSLIGDVLPSGSTVFMIVPLDSAAPKGRLILPQVQFLRDCLDHEINCLVLRETQLQKALQTMPTPDLVVTDSQIFGFVDSVVPPSIPLTSFSILLSRQKGDFEQLLSGTNALQSLPSNAHILMLEGCTHNQTHEDIGHVKIPALLRKKISQEVTFDFYSGYDFPENLDGYHMAIQCGGCMLNKREITNRLQSLHRSNIPVTNYGLVLAYGSGILERSIQVFKGGLT